MVEVCFNTRRFISNAYMYSKCNKGFSSYERDPSASPLDDVLFHFICKYGEFSIQFQSSSLGLARTEFRLRSGVTK